ncbi:MAG TPA: class I SAM-dependent methyltransferase [Anaerolineae bacterium]|nr:class I SAM-dependent methyltransferase [Anaerolineae bacterium]HNU03108.1 class I SAM-dependent methyltransferase [Anaerolineae bacterium]
MNSTQIDYDSVAEIYDLYVAADYDIPFFLEETAHVEGPVLELTAGTGRLSLALIQAGVPLTCVDASRGMLDVLSRKLRERGLNAEVLCADICELELPTRYQLALLPFQAFMEITGEARQRQALASVLACLAPGGRFICTMHNPAVRRAQVDGTLRLVGRFAIPDGSLVVSGFEQGGHPLVKRLQFFEFFNSDGSLRSKQLLPMEFEFVERDQFEAMALEAGFQVRALYGNYDRASFDAGRSPVMIWVLQRADAQPYSRSKPVCVSSQRGAPQAAPDCFATFSRTRGAISAMKRSN